MFNLLGKALGSVFKTIGNMTKRMQGKEPEGNKGKRRRYEVDAIRDSRTCEVCLRKDGTIVIVDPSDTVDQIATRMKENTPPFHINCRCQLKPIGIFRGVF